MTLSLSDLLKPQTRDQVLQEMLDVAATLGLPTTAWQPGQPIRTLLTTVSQKFADFTTTIVEIAKGGFGDLASAGWAQLWAKSTYDVDMVLAQPATGVGTATNTSPTTYTLNAGDLIVAHSVTGRTYRNTAPIVIPPNGSLANIAIQADVVGTGSDAAPGFITVVVSSLVGVSFTNPASVLGADDELPTALVSRARSKLGSLSPDGPKEAYNYVAETPAYSATSTPITRASTTGDPVTGEVTLTLATATGAPTGPDVAIVQTAINKWAEPWCTSATAVAAVNHTIDVTYAVWVRGSLLTVAQIETAIGDALAAYFSTLPIGGTVLTVGAPGQVFAEEIGRVIGGATPGIIRVALSAPASDVTIATSEVPVLGTISPVVTVVS
jgi:hypothetical protein